MSSLSSKFGNLIAIITFGLAVWLVAAIMASASPITSAIPDAKQRGEATFRYVGIAVYDAKLFTPGGAALAWDRDMALEITYRRTFSQAALVDSTIAEFSRLGTPLAIAGKLNACFESVNAGDRYLAVSKGADRIDFYLNGSKSCALQHPNIRKRFIEIFAGKNTRSKSFSRKLRGE